MANFLQPLCSLIIQKEYLLQQLKGKGILVIAEINNEIPVAPPSIKSLVNKNPLNQMQQKKFRA